MRFGKIQQGSWWQLGKLCEVPRCLLWKELRHHCPLYNVSCVCIFFNKCLYFQYYVAGYFPDRPCMWLWLCWPAPQLMSQDEKATSDFNSSDSHLAPRITKSYFWIRKQHRKEMDMFVAVWNTCSFKEKSSMNHKCYWWWPRVSIYPPNELTKLIMGFSHTIRGWLGSQCISPGLTTFYPLAGSAMHPTPSS